jgi:hypothetical protein
MRYVCRIGRIVAIATSLTFCAVCVSQNSEDQNPQDTMKSRIESIVHRSALPIRLNDSSSTVAITSAQIAIAAEDIQQVKQYGEEAIPVLSTYLFGENARSERVAIRLLGAIGRPAIVEALAKILEQSPRAASREDALRSLSQAPCSATVARLIVRVAENDPNTIVRDLAQKETSYCAMPTASKSNQVPR